MSDKLTCACVSSSKCTPCVQQVSDKLYLIWSVWTQRLTQWEWATAVVRKVILIYLYNVEEEVPHITVNELHLLLLNTVRVCWVPQTRPLVISSHLILNICLHNLCVIFQSCRNKRQWDGWQEVNVNEKWPHHIKFLYRNFANDNLLSLSFLWVCHN